MLTMEEIEEVFRGWMRQAQDAGEKAFLLWTQLLEDLRMKMRSKEDK